MSTSQSSHFIEDPTYFAVFRASNRVLVRVFTGHLLVDEKDVSACYPPIHTVSGLLQHVNSPDIESLTIHRTDLAAAADDPSFARSFTHLQAVTQLCIIASTGVDNIFALLKLGHFPALIKLTLSHTDATLSVLIDTLRRREKIGLTRI